LSLDLFIKRAAGYEPVNHVPRPLRLIIGKNVTTTSHHHLYHNSCSLYTTQ